TGSEVTPVAVLSDSERNIKVGISSPYIIPTASICDPELTLTCPPSLTAIAGADAMTHAVEAFTAIRRDPLPGIAQERVFVGKNALSDHFALRAIALLWEGLEAACTDGSDKAAREKVMMGATLAGLAFGVAGTAAAHAIQYPVGNLTHTAHGLGVATLLPYVMEFNRPHATESFTAIARALGLAGQTPEKLSAQLIDEVATLLAAIGIPATLRDLGPADDRLDWAAEHALAAGRLIRNNPRPLELPAMQRIVRAAYAGDRAGLRT